MRTRRVTSIAALPLLLAFVAVASIRLVGSPATPRAIQLQDMLAWKAINAAEVSTDGRWFGYRVSPLDGDSEVVVRETRGTKEYRIPVGESADAGGAGGPGGGPVGPSQAVQFSYDAKWAAVTVMPTKKEAAQLKKQRKPLENKVTLLDLATGDRIEVPRIRRFAFSGEAGTWIALHRYAAESPSRPAGEAGPAAAGAAAGSGAAARPRASDLLLRDLATASVLAIGNVSEFAFDKSGRWLAYTIEASDQIGNGLQLRDMHSGVVTPLDSDKASYERPTWTEKGDGLAVLKGAEDKRYKDRVYAVLGFTGFGIAPTKTVYDPARDDAFPKEMSISPARNPRWAEDLDAIVFGIRKLTPAEPVKAAEADKAKEAPAAEEKPRSDDAPDEDNPDLVLWHWKDSRLQSQQQVEESRDKDFSYLSVYRPAEQTFVRLADDEVREVTPAPKDRWAIGKDARAYELDGSLDGREFEDVYAIDLRTGARTLALKKSRWSYDVSPDGARLLYYEDGHYFAYDLASGQSRNLTLNVPASFVNTENDQNIVKPPVRPFGWTSDGLAVLLYDNWDVWKVPVGEGPAVNLTLDGRRDGVRYRRRYTLDRDEKGADLSKPQYFEIYGEWTKRAGIARLDPGKPGPSRLFWDDALYSRLIRAERADTVLYTRETFKDSPDFHVTDAALGAGTKITDINPQQKDFLWSSGPMLVEYKSDKGDRLQGALHLPANYEKGKTYPTIVYIYEKLSQGLNGYVRPTANGFNKSVYTSNGYAVLMPDITYRVNDPGMSAVWCVLPALKAAIAAGVVDPKRVGIHGHSWGGYQTAYLVTQTNMFAAAVAGAPLTNMVSMYSLIYKNSGRANQAIFESSQGRFKGGYWDNWEAYVRNSPVSFAKNVTTPLLILHNDKDGAVDFTQGVEYFNTLRRLKKPVVMLEYVGENHGLRKPANQRDYTVRMKEFFDHHLNGALAPPWLVEGVQRLDMETHLKERALKK
jgi:acetyl esterase/lipase